MYKNQKILILGAARSGIAAAKILASNNDVTISDLKELKKENEDLLKSLGVKIIITKDQCSLISKDYDLIIKNPAIMATSDTVKKIEHLGNKLPIEKKLNIRIPDNLLTKITTINELIDVCEKLSNSN